MLSPALDAMKNVTYNSKKYLHIVATCAAVVTAFWVATGVDWTWAYTRHVLWPALLVFVWVCVLGILPYGLYVFTFTRFQLGQLIQALVLAILLLIPLCLYGYWHLTSVRTGGLDFMFVPFLQVVYLVVLICALQVARMVKRAWVTKHSI